MLNHAVIWLVRLPTELATFLMLGAGVVASLALMLLFHAVVPRRLRTQHNDVAGFTLAIVGVVYAVLLAFIAVAIWENYDHAGSQLQMEADLTGDLARDAATLPDPLAAAVRREVADYARTVTLREWPALAAAEPPPPDGWRNLDRLRALLTADPPGDSAQASARAEMVAKLDRLYDARRDRFVSPAASLPAIVWWNLGAGAAVVVVFTCFFGVPSIWMHGAMVAMLAVSISLVLALVLLLYNPYDGSSQISAAPFSALLSSMQAGGRS